MTGAVKRKRSIHKVTTYAAIAFALLVHPVYAEEESLCYTVESCRKDGAEACKPLEEECPPCVYTLNDEFTCWDKDQVTNTCPFAGIKYDCSDVWKSLSNTTDTALESATVSHDEDTTSFPHQIGSSSGDMSTSSVASSEGSSVNQSVIVLTSVLGVAVVVCIGIAIVVFRNRQPGDIDTNGISGDFHHRKSERSEQKRNQENQMTFQQGESFRTTLSRSRTGPYHHGSEAPILEACSSPNMAIMPLSNSLEGTFLEIPDTPESDGKNGFSEHTHFVNSQDFENTGTPNMNNHNTINQQNSNQEYHPPEPKPYNAPLSANNMNVLSSSQYGMSSSSRGFQSNSQRREPPLEISMSGHFQDADAIIRNKMVTDLPIQFSHEQSYLMSSDNIVAYSPVTSFDNLQSSLIDSRGINRVDSIADSENSLHDADAIIETRESNRVDVIADSEYFNNNYEVDIDSRGKNRIDSIADSEYSINDYQVNIDSRGKNRIDSIADSEYSVTDYEVNIDSRGKNRIDSIVDSEYSVTDYEVNIDSRAKNRIDSIADSEYSVTDYEYNIDSRGKNRIDSTADSEYSINDYSNNRFSNQMSDIRASGESMSSEMSYNDEKYSFFEEENVVADIPKVEVAVDENGKEIEI